MVALGNMRTSMVISADWVYYGGQAQAIALDPERPNVVWAGLGGAYVEQLMIKSTDYGKLGTWQSSDTGLPKTNKRGVSKQGLHCAGFQLIKRVRRTTAPYMS